MACADEIDEACIVDLRNHEKAGPSVLDSSIAFEANPFEIVTVRVKI